MLPWFNHDVFITIKRKDPNMGTDRFIWHCDYVIKNLRYLRAGEVKIKSKRFRIEPRFHFNDCDGTVSECRIRIRYVTRKESLKICEDVETYQDVEIDTFCM